MIASVRLPSIAFEAESEERNRTDSVLVFFPLLVGLSDALTARSRNNISLIRSMMTPLHAVDGRAKVRSPEKDNEDHPNGRRKK